MLINASTIVLTAPDANAPLFAAHNLVAVSNVSASSTTDADFPVTNLGNPNTNLRWQASASGARTITVAHSYAGLCDYVGIAGHNFGTAGITVSIVAVNPDTSTTVLIPPFQPADNTPILLRFDPRIMTSVQIGLGAGSAAARMAVLYTGKMVVSERRVYVGHTPITMGRATKVVSGRSENGNFLGRIITQESVSSEIKLQNLHAAWYRTYFDPFLRSVAGAPFFFAWRPASYPTEVGFVWLTGDPRPMNAKSNGMMDVDLSFAGIIA